MLYVQKNKYICTFSFLIQTVKTMGLTVFSPNRKNCKEGEDIETEAFDMSATLTNNTIRNLRYCLVYLPSVSSSLFTKTHCALAFMERPKFSTFAHSSTSGGAGRGNDRQRLRGRGSGGAGSGIDKIEALGRLMTRILRHMASELKLNMRSDGYVRVNDILKLNMKTFADLPLRSHSIEDVREAVRTDNKQRFGLLEENGELLIRANQGHSITTIVSENLLKPILSAEEVQVCVHGTYKKNLQSILEAGLKRMDRFHVHFSCALRTNGAVTSGLRHDVNVLIFLDVRKALEDGMKLYISENNVILTEGFDGVVPVKYFEKIESWPRRQPIPF